MRKLTYSKLIFNTMVFFWETRVGEIKVLKVHQRFLVYVFIHNGYLELIYE